MPRLRVLRLNAGLNQKELARAAGVSEATIKRLEAGRGKRPYPATRRRIAAVLRVPISEVDELKADDRDDDRPAG
jgi:transcriptional regulator with XRE-family HTH domain